jgi:AcrR family transcriptional regulator
VTAAAGLGDADQPPAGRPRPSSRRDRLRAATKDEIIQTARRLLVRDGPASMSLRAIAREMGMTAPGLYRYFGSHEELIRHVVADIFNELGADLKQAILDVEEAYAAGDASSSGSSGANSAAGDEPDLAKLTDVVFAVCREFRRWGLNHRGEFALIFGAPLPGIDDGRHDIADECALQFASVFFTLFLELWDKARFPVPTPEQIDPSLLDQLSRYLEWFGADLPPGAILVFLRCWVLLYGAVAMEVFGHLSFALTDPAPMFEVTLRSLAEIVGLRGPATATAP